MPTPPRRDYRTQSAVAGATQTGREILAMIGRRVPIPVMMSGTVTAWDGASGSATVEPDDTADDERQETIHAESHIGPVLVGERVWLHTISGATYITGRGSMTWQSAKDATQGHWFPQGRVGSGDGTRLTADPYLGLGAVSQAGFSVDKGQVTLTYSVRFGTGASNTPTDPQGNVVPIETFTLPLPVALSNNFGWDVYTRQWTGGTLFFFDGSDYVGTHLSYAGRDYVELRVAQAGTGGQSLGVGAWPNGFGFTPLAGTLISGTFTYPAAV